MKKKIKSILKMLFIMLFILKKRKNFLFFVCFCIFYWALIFRDPAGRKRRDVDNQQFPSSADSDQSEIEVIKNVTENGTWKTFNFTVYGKTELHISSLHHFTEYRINLTVCRAVETKEDANTSCSIPFERSESTRKKG